jgi:glycosyltransferase involved in cell wall biosynthesis
MRIAFFVTLPPIRSALADFNEGLALGLCATQGISLDLIISGQYKPDSSILLDRCKVYDPHEFDKRQGGYDICLYSLGDHGEYHGYMLDYIQKRPGIVILNDLTLHRCILQNALLRNDVQLYLRDLKYAHGLSDMRLADQIHAGLGNQLIMEYPMFQRIVDASLGIVVQNQYAQRKILERCPRAKIQCIPYPFFMPPGFPDYQLEEMRRQQRDKLNLNGHLVFGSFGIFVPDKHLEHCLSTFSRVVSRHPKSVYILGGVVAEGYDLQGRIREMGLEKQVMITGWMPPAEFVRYMFALDVGMHLRYPHIGGTPYTPVRLMGLGICTFVSDIEPLKEIPSGACIKIAPGIHQESALAALLEYVADHPDFRRQVSDNGREFIAQHHQLHNIADEYVRFAEQLV